MARRGVMVVIMIWETLKAIFIDRWLDVRKLFRMRRRRTSGFGGS